MRVSCIRILAAPSLYVRVHSQLRHVQIQTTAVTSHTCPVIHIHVRQLSSDVSSTADMPHRILICYERVLLPDKSAEGGASCHEGQYCRTRHAGCTEHTPVAGKSGQHGAHRHPVRAKQNCPGDS